jgi:hypothetical protein
LHWAGRGCAQDVQACRVVGVGVVHERFLTVQFEDGGSEKGALRVSQALIQINDNSHVRTPLAAVPFSGLNRQREINPEGKKVECGLVKLLVFELKNYEGHGALAYVIFAA